MFRAIRFTATVASLALAAGLPGASTQAVAQESAKKNAAKTDAAKNSKEFAGVYQVAAKLATGDAPNWQAAASQADTLVAAIRTDADRKVTGNYLLTVGQKVSDNQMQLRGLELILESGLAPSDKIGVYNYYVAQLAFNEKDYELVRNSLNAAVAAGYVDNDDAPRNDPEFLIVQSYMEENRPADAVAYVGSLVEAAQAGGKPVADPVLRTGLQAAINNNFVAEANKLSLQLIKDSPSEPNWMAALQVYATTHDLDAQAQLDLYRLMRLNNVMSQKAEFVRYIEAADPRVMGNEVLALLADASQSGILPSSDPYHKEVKSIAAVRAPLDRRDIEATVRDGRGGNARVAFSTGDVLYSLDDFARAEEFYRLALDKGYDRDMTLTRIGIAQTRKGDYSGAVETFGKVQGDRSGIAALWSVYAQQKAAM